MLRYNSILRNSFLLLDLIFLNITCLVSIYISNKLTGITYNHLWGEYFILVNLLWLVVSYQTKFYFTEITFHLLARKTISIHFIHFLLMLICFFITQKYNTSRLQMGIYYAMQISCILLSRYLFLVFKPTIRPLKRDRRRVILIGNCPISQKAESFLKRPDSGYEFFGYFDDLNFEKNDHSAVERCLQYAISNNVNEIYSTILPANELLQDFIRKADQHFIRFKYIPNFDIFFLRSVNLKIENGLPVICMRKEPLENIENRFVKRLFDVAFSSLFFFLIFWWIYLLLAILIKITSRGPVFFIQKRSGRNGKVFNCYKFRSMYVNGESDHKSADKEDDRFTPIGRFLRKSNLDEFPQFYNVLKGDMSIVGPRPHMLKHTEEYGKIINTFMVRHFLKPGITGWAQVNGYRGDLTGDKMTKRVEHDVWYLENWTFFIDIKIIIKTIFLTFKGDDNAY
ncbi:MAG: exopolysaccharide biosynthesis polyprenyl glycosylphosphotransferase [Bacteroidota bacterium]